MSPEPVPATWFHEGRRWDPPPGRLAPMPAFGPASVFLLVIPVFFPGAPAPAPCGEGGRTPWSEHRPEHRPAWRYYSRCYPRSVVTKRSVSLDDEVASAVEEAARQDGVSFSAWLSSAAEKQLRVRQGLRGVAAWEGETGSLSAEEVAAGEALLARLRSGMSGVASRVRRR